MPHVYFDRGASAVVGVSMSTVHPRIAYGTACPLCRTRCSRALSCRCCHAFALASAFPEQRFAVRAGMDGAVAAAASARDSAARAAAIRKLGAAPTAPPVKPYTVRRRRRR